MPVPQLKTQTLHLQSHDLQNKDPCMPVMSIWYLLEATEISIQEVEGGYHWPVIGCGMSIMSSEPNRTSLHIMVKLAVDASKQYLPCQPHEMCAALAQTRSVWPLILSETSYQILFLLLLLQFHYSSLACLTIHHSSSPIWKELQIQPNLQLLTQTYMWDQCGIRAHHTSKPYRHTETAKVA